MYYFQGNKQQKKKKIVYSIVKGLKGDSGLK